MKIIVLCAGLLSGFIFTKPFPLSALPVLSEKHIFTDSSPQVMLFFLLAHIGCVDSYFSVYEMKDLYEEFNGFRDFPPETRQKVTLLSQGKLITVHLEELCAKIRRALPADELLKYVRLAQRLALADGVMHPMEAQSLQIIKAQFSLTSNAMVP